MRNLQLVSLYIKYLPSISKEGQERVGLLGLLDRAESEPVQEVQSPDWDALMRDDPEFKAMMDKHAEGVRLSNAVTKQYWDECTKAYYSGNIEWIEKAGNRLNTALKIFDLLYEDRVF